MNTAVTYEIDYYIFEQEIIFILSRANNVQNRNFWKQETVIKALLLFLNKLFPITLEYKKE